MLEDLLEGAIVRSKKTTSSTVEDSKTSLQNAIKTQLMLVNDEYVGEEDDKPSSWFKELNEDEENYKFTPMVGIYPLDTTGKEYWCERTDKAKQKMWVNAINKAIQDGTYDKRCAEIDKLKEAAAEKTKATNDLINPIKKKYALKRKSLDKRESIPLKSGGPRKRAIAKAPEEYHAQVEELENAEEDEIAKAKEGLKPDED